MTHETTAPVTSLVDEVLAALEVVAYLAPREGCTVPARFLEGHPYQRSYTEPLVRLVDAKALIDKQAAQVAVPDDWRLVPLKPTQEMWAAYRNADDGNILFHQGYRAMLSAAPTQPAFQCVSILQDVPVHYSANAGSTAVNPDALLPGTHAPTLPAQPLDLKHLCTHFYYWWHNQPGTNTEQGFDEWLEKHGRPMLAQGPWESPCTPPAQPVAWTGSGSLAAIKEGAEGFIWGAPGKAHPIPLYAAPPAQQGKWTPVNEGLPELGTPVWLYDPDCGTFFGMRFSSTGGWAWAEGVGLDLSCQGGPAFRDIEHSDCEPTHWMPLPAAPGDTAAPEQAEQPNSGRELISRLVAGLEWALPELNMQPYEWGSGEESDAHQAAIDAIAEARALLGGEV